MLSVLIFANNLRILKDKAHPITDAPYLLKLVKSNIVEMYRFSICEVRSIKKSMPLTIHHYLNY